MEEWLVFVTGKVVVLINAFALAVILYGALEAFVAAARIVVRPSRAAAHFVWLRFGRWLVAGLTFQLAADIVETSIAPNWEEIGKLAAIAVVRTGLNYFLERDMREIAEATDDRSAE